MQLSMIPFPSFQNRTGGVVGVVLLVGGASACRDQAKADEAVYQNLDTPAPIPVGKKVEKKRDEGSKTSDAGQLVEQCEATTGRREDGKCERLSVKDVVYTQRVLIPAGRFVQGFRPDYYDGSTTGLPGSPNAIRWSGQPPRNAEVESFWIDLHEVTREAYQKCVEAGECTPALCPDGSTGLPDSKRTITSTKDLEDRLPQTCVSHQQAETFCQARGGRLPTELEWEFAARGPDGRRYPWGNEMRDELPPGIFPIGRMADQSYFKILSMGANAIEWVADEFDPELNLRPFLKGSFRQANGPVEKSVREWEQEVYCPEGQKSCDLTKHRPKRYVVKRGRPGTRGAAYDAPEDGAKAGLPELSPEGWRAYTTHQNLGFRCAEDRSENDPKLVVPADAPEVPHLIPTGDLQFFFGVAESVNHQEAKRFCKALEVEGKSDWRLPTLQEVNSIANWFTGPGPFWAKDGAIQFSGMGDEWVRIDKKAEDTALARCIRNAD